MGKTFQIAVVVISLTMFLNFLFTAAMGVYKTVHAFVILYTQGTSGKPGLEIVESLDLFLVALVFLILSFGFIQLFYPSFRMFQELVLPWLKIEDFYQLKRLAWDAFLLTMLITFGTDLLRAEGQLDWKMLVTPIAVLLFSVSSKLLRH